MPDSSCSFTIILAAVKASTAAPSWMMIGKRSTSFSTMVEPNTTIGTLISRPSTTRSIAPCAAPATPSTLSMPISASAMMMVFMAPQKVVAPGPWPSSSPPWSAISL